MDEDGWMAWNGMESNNRMDGMDGNAWNGKPRPKLVGEIIRLLWFILVTWCFSVALDDCLQSEDQTGGGAIHLP